MNSKKKPNDSCIYIQCKDCEDYVLGVCQIKREKMPIDGHCDKLKPGIVQYDDFSKYMNEPVD